MRDNKGRFVKGTSGNPSGRPKSEINYHEILVTSVSADDWKQIVYKALEQAKNGDSAARKFITDYLVGPAKNSLEITGSIDVLDLDWSGWNDTDEETPEASPS